MPPRSRTIPTHTHSHSHSNLRPEAPAIPRHTQPPRPTHRRAHRQRPPRTLSDIDAELARFKAERAAKKVQQQFEGAAAASSASSSSSADGPGVAGAGGQSAIATTTSAFYGRRAAGEGVAGTVLAGNDGERMV